MSAGSATGNGMATLAGTASADTLTGTTGADTIEGFGGDDLIDGGPAGPPHENDYLLGGSGNDTVIGRSMRAFLGGDDGDDRIVAHGEASYLVGGSGNDTLVGADNVTAEWTYHADALVSERFAVGSGADVVTTGAGFDLIELDSHGFGRFTVTDFGADDLITVDYRALRAEDVFVDEAGILNIDLDADGFVERQVDIGGAPDGTVLEVRQAGSDEVPVTVIRFVRTAERDVRGTSGGDLYRGGTANDRLAGMGGDDVLDGAGGADTLIGGAGADVLSGGDGDDLIYAGEVDGTGRALGETLIGGAGDDTIYSAASTADWSHYVIDGGAGADRLYGTAAGESFVDALGASDLVRGGGGRDLFRLDAYGSAGDHVIVLDGERLSEDGLYEDTLEGISEVDISTGAGNDVLVVRAFGVADGTHAALAAGQGTNFLDASGADGAILWADGTDDVMIGTDGSDSVSLSDGTVFTGGGRDQVSVYAHGEDTRVVVADFSGEDELYLGTLPLGAAPTVEVGAERTLITFVSYDGLATVVLAGRYDGGFDLDPDGYGTTVRFVGAREQAMWGGTYGDDLVEGGASDDEVLGFHGDDTLVGGLGSDTVTGGEGADVIYGDGAP